MLIVCPKCDTSYRVDRSAFGPDGRRVRCTRCMTTWQASADGAQPIATAMAPTEPAVETTEAVLVATTVEVPPFFALALKLSKVLAPVAGGLTAKTIPCSQ